MLGVLSACVCVPCVCACVCVMQVAQQRQQLRWDSNVPSDYKKLAQDCMAWDMDARPTFAQIVQRIDGMRHGEDL